MFLVYFAFAFLLGIAAASWLALPFLAWVWLLIWPLGFLAVWRRDENIQRVLFVFFVFMLGALRFAFANQPPDANAVVNYNEHGRATLTGIVVGPPDVRDTYTNLRVDVSQIAINGVVSDTHGLVLVQAPRVTDAQYGDQVRVEGTLTTPSESADFSYRDYLARQDIYSQMLYARATVLTHDQANSLLTLLYAIRDRAHATINAILPAPHAALLSGILLGDANGMPSDLTNDFSATNTTHIIAISGFNIAVVAGVLTGLVGLVTTKRRGAIFIIMGLALYTLFVGAGASVVRAAIMGSLSVIALQLNRQTLALNSLAVSVLLMLAWNPNTAWDVGFQLSALATLGLIEFVPGLRETFNRVLLRFTPAERARGWMGFIEENFLVTLAAQIATTGIIVYTFNRLSLIGLVTNFLILPVQAYVMIFGGIATLAGMIFLPLGQALGWLAWVFLQWTIVVVRYTGELPNAALDLGHLDASVLILYYVIVVAIWRWRSLVRYVNFANVRALFAGSRFAFFVSGGVLLFLGTALALQSDGRTHIESLATNGGEATYIRTANGARILIDASNAPSQIVSALGQRIPPWDQHLDALILTQNDDAHLNGATAVVERYTVGLILEPSAPNRRTPAYTQWRALVDQRKINSQITSADLSFDVDNVKVQVLYPPDNGDNVALRVTAGDQKILFASALTKAELAELKNTVEDLSAQTVIPPRVADEAFFAQVNAEAVILFVGRGAREVPANDFLALTNPATVLRTDDTGTIEMVMDGRMLEVKTQR